MGREAAVQVFEERACERVWGVEKGRGVRELVEKLTGMPCACDRGLRCPLLPDVQAQILMEQEVRQQSCQQSSAAAVGPLPAA